jgi:hypothetical protein
MKAKQAFFSAVLLILVLALAEGLSYAAGRILQQKWAMWRVPTKPQAAKEALAYDEYMKHRDPVVGWPFPKQYGAHLDVNGAQRNPHFPDGPAKGSCVSLYGDSFTEGGDISADDKRWSNLLSRELGCYVANFGQGGYGTDQAYLRFLENRSDPSAVVIFGIQTSNVARNLTRIRDLENYEKWYALKPRFILDSERRLRLVPIPSLTEDEYLRVLTERSPQLILEHETLHPGGPAGAVKLQFPYTLSVVNNVLRFPGFRSRVLGYPEWMALLERGHALQGLEITVAITSEFAQLAAKREKSPVVVILPHPEDFTYFLKKGVWPYHTMVEELRRAQVVHGDFGPFLLAAAKEAGKRVTHYFGPTGHYNDDGNALLARFVDAHLRERGLAGPKLIEMRFPASLERNYKSAFEPD